MKIIKTQKVTLTAPVTFEVEIPDSKRQNFRLLYKKLTGEEKVYRINEIVFMDNRILKSVVDGVGYRSFRTDRVISLLPL